MPELPEVERVRRSLAAQVMGRAIRAVEVRRPGVVRGDRSDESLLRGQRISSIERLGKQLAIRGKDCCLCVHLGMTGSLCVTPRKAGPSRPRSSRKHTHVTWHLDDGRSIEFHDPRRFGGIWTYPNRAALIADRWRHLGPDALLITPRELHAALRRTKRGIKAALLDQAVVAGLGNIYVDELLFGCSIHPLARASRLKLKHIEELVPRMRRLLDRAITAGGSSVRDYVDADGQTGSYQLSHQVYGRRGLPCRRCDKPLLHIRVGGRMTVFCRGCQERV